MCSQWAAGWIHMKGLTLGDRTGAGEVHAGRSAMEWSIHTDHSQLRRGPTGLQESTDAPFIFFWWKLLVGSPWSVGIDDGVMKIMRLEGESFLQKKKKSYRVLTHGMPYLKQDRAAELVRCWPGILPAPQPDSPLEGLSSLRMNGWITLLCMNSWITLLPDLPKS